MSELLQHGNHPDSDQLNAFAEYVLPEHERLETLAHLAECADCRQIVFLAQHAQEADDRLLQEVPGRSGWWKNWRILRPAAAALTCGLLVVVFLQRRHPADLAQRSDVALESSAVVAPSKAEAPRPSAPAAPRPGPPASPSRIKKSAELPPYTAIWRRIILETVCLGSTEMCLLPMNNQSMHCPPALRRTVALSTPPLHRHLNRKKRKTACPPINGNKRPLYSLKINCSLNRPRPLVL